MRFGASFRGSDKSSTTNLGRPAHDLLDQKNNPICDIPHEFRVTPAGINSIEDDLRLPRRV